MGDNKADGRVCRSVHQLRCVHRGNAARVIIIDPTVAPNLSSQLP